MTDKRLTRQWAWEMAARHLECATDQAETPEDMIAIAREYRLLAGALPASTKQKAPARATTPAPAPPPEDE